MPSGMVRCFDIPLNVKAGSRALGNSACSSEVFVLENGSSRLWLLNVDGKIGVQELTNERSANIFRSSLGSRMVQCASGLVVTGTPGNGAHTPWLFDLQAKKWTKLPDAPWPILSSAVVVNEHMLTIVGGWSKAWSCHGHTQTLDLRLRGSWDMSEAASVPWRRPGAGIAVAGHVVIALGWMECIGRIGEVGFQLLKRNGGSQRAHTSSSKLCTLHSSGHAGASEISSMPFADSFEHSGELYALADNIMCIGRDHLQVFNMSKRSWTTMHLPRELNNDGSNSWVKHCGSWALAFLQQASTHPEEERHGEGKGGDTIGEGGRSKGSGSAGANEGGRVAGRDQGGCSRRWEVSG
jgi:hypothetical protein